jgi:hypothetical protein
MAMAHGAERAALLLVDQGGEFQGHGRFSLMHNELGVNSPSDCKGSAPHGFLRPLRARQVGGAPVKLGSVVLRALRRD